MVATSPHGFPRDDSREKILIPGGDLFSGSAHGRNIDPGGSPGMIPEIIFLAREWLI
jgi:hypothetical protein